MLNLFFKVLEMSATASIVILIILALRLCLRKAPKVYSYALWSVVLFRLLCPFSIESSVSIIPARTAPTQTEIARYEAIEAGEEYLAAYHAVGDALNGGLDFIDVKLEPEYVQSLEEGAQHGATALTHAEVWTLLLASLWPAGGLFLLARSMLSMGKLKRSLRGAGLLRDNIYLSQNIQTPFTMGLLRPAIYLPEGLNEHEQSYIICHEEYHIRRFDHVVKVLAFAALCVHWFNPLVWLAFHLAGKDMEMSCDEAVVKRMGSGIRADYSASLLTLATGRRMAVGTHLAFGDGDTKGRIKNVLNWKKPKVWVSIAACLICAAGICACAVDPVEPETPIQNEPVQEDVQNVRRDMAIENLEPGQTHYLNEDIVLTGDDSCVEYQITYARTGLTMRVGLRYEDGTEYFEDIGGGSNTSSFSGLPAGRYTPFVRNLDVGYREDPNATGAIVFNLTSQKDFFQKSTPFVQEEPVQPVKLTPEEVLHNAILDHHRSSQSGQYFCCESHIILANESAEQSHPVTEKLVKTMTYYLWVLYQEYLFTEDGIVEEGGAHIPTIITLAEREDGTYELLNYIEPRDGSYYVEDIKKFFPGSSVEEALDSQKYILAQKQDCYEQAVAYAKTDPDVKMDVDTVIEGLLDKICSEPMPFSYTGAYLEAHPIEYRELLYYGDYTREYCARQLQSESGEMGLRRSIWEMLLDDLGG